MANKKKEGTYYERNKEKLKKKSLEYYWKNREKIIERSKRYIKDHAEQHRLNMIKSQKNRSKKRKDYAVEYYKNMYHNDRTYKRRLYLSTYHSNFINGIKPTFSEYVGLPLNEYKDYVSSLLPRGLTWADYNKSWRIAHINTELDPFDMDSIKEYYNYKNVKVQIFKVIFED